MPLLLDELAAPKRDVTLSCSTMPLSSVDITYVCQCGPMCTDVYRCLSICFDICRCIPMCDDLKLLCTEVCRSVPMCSDVYRHVPMCSDTYADVYRYFWLNKLPPLTPPQPRMMQECTRFFCNVRANVQNCTAPQNSDCRKHPQSHSDEGFIYRNCLEAILVLYS